MAATVVIRSFHGATGTTPNDIDNGSCRFKAADNDTVDANNPLVIGGSTIYSFLKQFKFRITGTAPSNSITNLKVYSDGANGLGTGVDIAVNTSASYVDPTTQAQTQLSGLTTSVFTYTSASPLAVTGTGSTINTDVGDYIRMQMSVTSSAVQGTTASETLTFSYDES